MWEKIISHAMTCDKDDGTKYTYHAPGESIGLLFNSIYQVVAAIFNGQNYCSLDELDVFQKVCFNILEIVFTFECTNPLVRN